MLIEPSDKMRFPYPTKKTKTLSWDVDGLSDIPIYQWNFWKLEWYEFAFAQHNKLIKWAMEIEEPVLHSKKYWLLTGDPGSAAVKAPSSNWK